MKKVLSHNSIKKRVDKSGLWKQSPEDFDPSSAEDFWNVVNGHDILAILRLINEDAETAYSNAGGVFRKVFFGRFCQEISLKLTVIR